MHMEEEPERERMQTTEPTMQNTEPTMQNVNQWF